MAKDIRDGHILDFISGQEIKATPEEVEATQVFSKRLVEEYVYLRDTTNDKRQTTFQYND